MTILWYLFVVLELASIVKIHSNGLKKGKVSSQDMRLEVTDWYPYSNLREYHTFQDVKIYALNVPTYTSEMALLFHYVGLYSHSHKPCNDSITVLLQQGSPAVPYRDEIKTKCWLYNFTYIYKTVISLNKSEWKIISSPLPGLWYVTAFLPYVEKVKKIKEKGLSKPSEKCLSALSIRQVLESPVQAAVIIAKDQIVQQKASIRQKILKYYQYFVPDYSKSLRVELKNLCQSKLQNCSLRLAVSAKSLPSSNTTNCLANSDNGCVLHIEWPQPATNYYIGVSGVSSGYEITANHTDCIESTPGCYPIIDLNIVYRSRLKNIWEVYRLNKTQSFYSLYIHPNYVGTTLYIGLNPVLEDNNTTYKMCIRKDSPPFGILESKLPSQRYCRSRNDSDIAVKVLFPQAGKWYIGVSIQSTNMNYIPELKVFAKTEACLDPNCGGHGSCVKTSDVGISYGVCVCDYGYTGWTCTHYTGVDILAICLLTISNIAFLPGIIVACKRKFYPEAIVYLFNMYCSTVYHACDSHGYCIYDYNILQLSDFFASILSVWFTLMAMVKLSPLWHRTFNIFGTLCLFIGIQLSRFGVTVTAVPAGVGLGIVLISFGLRSYYRQKCFPSYKRWLFFILPGAVLAVVAITIYTCLETTANYKYLHSIWHISIGLCIPLLLPSVRKAKLFVEYNMIRQLDEAENFHDSRDSLILNPCITIENDIGDESNSEKGPNHTVLDENQLKEPNLRV